MSCILHMCRLVCILCYFFLWISFCRLLKSLLNDFDLVCVKRKKRKGKSHSPTDSEWCLIPLNAFWWDVYLNSRGNCFFSKQAHFLWPCDGWNGLVRKCIGYVIISYIRSCIIEGTVWSLSLFFTHLLVQFFPFMAAAAYIILTAQLTTIDTAAANGTQSFTLTSLKPAIHPARTCTALQTATGWYWTTHHIYLFFFKASIKSWILQL